MSRTAYEIIMRAKDLELQPHFVTKNGAKELAKIIYNQDFFDLPKEEFLDRILMIIDSFESDKVSEFDIIDLFGQELDYYYDVQPEMEFFEELKENMKF